MRFDPLTILVWMLAFAIPWALAMGLVWLFVKAVRALWP